MEIKARSEALLVRISNFESLIVKGHAGALKDVCGNLSEQIQKMKELVNKGISELKLDSVKQQLVVLQDSKAEKPRPETLPGQIESLNNRLGLIVKYREWISKSANRLKNGVPAQFLQEGSIQQLLRTLEALVKMNNALLNDAGVQLAECKSLMEKLVSSTPKDK